ncbi:MAG: DUF2971 domain-containing protein [Holosporales bacterium]
MTNTNPAPHDVLVHYTDAQGLEGILSNNTLWATHWDHTNDAEELQTGLRILERFKKTKFWEDKDFRTTDFFHLNKFEEQENAVGTEKFWRETIERIKDITEQATDTMKIYICSFSKTRKNERHLYYNGRLSQWRAYGDYGIVFNKDKLDNLTSTFLNNRGGCGLGLIWEHVRYIDIEEKITGEEDIYKLVLDYIKKFFEHKQSKHVASDHNNRIAEALFKLHAKIIFCVKDKGFEEEKEHRLAICYYPNEHHKNNEQITVRRNRIVPYTNLFCPHNPLPIEKILIGPAPAGEQEERKKTVEALLRHLNKNIPVHCSAIPYRG